MLAATNRALEDSGQLPAGVWGEWLWDSQADEQVHPEVLLNRSHLLGLLVCRYKALRGGHGVESQVDARLSIVKKPAAQMSLRELRDSLANLQYEWPRFLERLVDNPCATQNLLAAKGLLERLFARFGELSWGKFGPEVLDDPGETQPAVGDETLLVLTPGCLRRTLGVFQCLYRHVHLLAVADVLPRKSERTHKLTKYHHEASTDKFHTLCMFYKLPVGAVLAYKNDFIGMYNHVSQVVYYHDAKYVRTPRCRVEDITTAEAIQVLPSILELHPEIPVVYEENGFNPTVGKGWYWLLIPGRIYLVTPEPRVLYSEDALALLDVYLATQAFLS